MNRVNKQTDTSTRARRRSTVAFQITLVFSMLLVAVWCVGQTGSSISESPRAVLRLRVKVKTSEATKSLTGLSRKRFFLIKGSLEQNKTLIAAMDQQPLMSRDCYYTRAGASPSLINWLKENDCESVYCRELTSEDVEGPHAVSEFASALSAGEKTYGNRQLALKWLTVNLPEKLRDGFYRQRQTEIASIVKQAEAASGAKVISVMTDRNGTAFFTDLEAGNYTLSNIAGAEIGQSVSLWNCDVQIKADDVSTEKIYTISNRKDKNVKCVAVEKPLPACTP
ncbi:MAG TPA: hypothetical protein VHR36_01865 [Pyrinomonadaceae bacterium]|nr:hypothetical protein [Pyrinomonadaceae bacterium]